MSNFINAGVEELKQRLKINHEEIGYLETRLDRAKSDNKKLEKENKFLKEENKRLREKLSEITMVADDEKQSIEHILELEEEIRSLELEKRNREVESEELKMWLREKLPLALLKEYMEKFEGVDLKNV